MSKLIIIAIFVVAGVVAGIIREISRKRRKFAQENLIDKLKGDSKFAHEILEDLDFPYGRIRYSRDVFDVLKRRMNSLTFLGPYRILNAVNVGEDCILLFTELSFTDFQLTASGKAGDVSEKAFHNFSLKHDQSRGEMTLRSDAFSDVTNKFQKEDFLKYLKELDSN